MARIWRMGTFGVSWRVKYLKQRNDLAESFQKKSIALARDDRKSDRGSRCKIMR